MTSNKRERHLIKEKDNKSGERKTSNKRERHLIKEKDI